MQVVSSGDDIIEKLEAAQAFATAKGIASSAGSLWFNGLISKGGSNWRGALYMAVQAETPNLQASLTLAVASMRAGFTSIGSCGEATSHDLMTVAAQDDVSIQDYLTGWRNALWCMLLTKHLLP